MSGDPTEPDLVAERYARREAIPQSRYSLLAPDVWQLVQERERALLRLFVRHGAVDLAALRVTEVGSGNGANLLWLLRLGFAPGNLAGIELLPQRHEQAQRALPGAVALTLGDALAAPVPAASQDLVLQFTVFSSLLDPRFQQRLAQAMWHWLKPGGAVVWYDFVFDNPRNPDVRGVPLARVRALFPQGHIDARRVTLAPPIARRVCRVHPVLYTLLNALPLLRTHVLAWIEKPRS
jgi:SAM-dependent methyltransferase